MSKNTHHYFVLYKPDGYLSQFINNGPQKKRIKLLGELGSFPEGTMAVGRLDLQSEGLLLLTTNGKWSDRVCRSGIEKEYHVQVDGLITEQAMDSLRAGVSIAVKQSNHHTKPCAVYALEEEPELPKRYKPIRHSRHGPTSWLSITLTEGKFRQIRKMTAAVGFPTLRLVRVRIGPFAIDDLQPGQFRVVSQADVRSME